MKAAMMTAMVRLKPPQTSHSMRLVGLFIESAAISGPAGGPPSPSASLLEADRGSLFLEPGLKISRLHHMDDSFHGRMAVAAKLGAVDLKGAGLRCKKMDRNA